MMEQKGVKNVRLMAVNTRRKRWSQTSMVGAVKAVKEGLGLREAAKSYNVPVETLRRRVIGAVSL